MKSDQPFSKRFPYRPEVKYLAIFLPVIVSIPVMTTVIFYYLLLPAWSEPSSQEFQNIKGILVEHGNLSYNEGEKFSLRNISNIKHGNLSYNEGEKFSLRNISNIKHGNLSYNEGEKFSFNSNSYAPAVRPF